MKTVNSDRKTAKKPLEKNRMTENERLAWPSVIHQSIEETECFIPVLIMLRHSVTLDEQSMNKYQFSAMAALETLKTCELRPANPLSDQVSYTNR